MITAGSHRMTYYWRRPWDERSREAESGEDAAKWCRTNNTDVILMDMNMPGIGGLEATKKILSVSTLMLKSSF